MAIDGNFEHLGFPPIDPSTGLAAAATRSLEHAIADLYLTAYDEQVATIIQEVPTSVAQSLAAMLPDDVIPRQEVLLLTNGRPVHPQMAVVSRVGVPEVEGLFAGDMEYFYTAATFFDGSNLASAQANHEVRLSQGYAWHADPVYDPTRQDITRSMGIIETWFEGHKLAGMHPVDMPDPLQLYSSNP